MIMKYLTDPYQINLTKRLKSKKKNNTTILKILENTKTESP